MNWTWTDFSARVCVLYIHSCASSSGSDNVYISQAYAHMYVYNAMFTHMQIHCSTCSKYTLRTDTVKYTELSQSVYFTVSVRRVYLEHVEQCMCMCANIALYTSVLEDLTAAISLRENPAG